MMVSSLKTKTIPGSSKVDVRNDEYMIQIYFFDWIISWPHPKRVIFPERVDKFDSLATLIPDSSRLPPGRGKVHHALWCHFLFEERSCHHNPQDTGLLKNWMLNVAMAVLFFSCVMSFFQIPIRSFWFGQITISHHSIDTSTVQELSAEHLGQPGKGHGQTFADLKGSKVFENLCESRNPTSTFPSQERTHFPKHRKMKQF